MLQSCSKGANTYNLNTEGDPIKGEPTCTPLSRPKTPHKQPFQFKIPRVFRACFGQPDTVQDTAVPVEPPVEQEDSNPAKIKDAPLPRFKFPPNVFQPYKYIYSHYSEGQKM